MIYFEEFTTYRRKCNKDTIFVAKKNRTKYFCLKKKTTKNNVSYEFILTPEIFSENINDFFHNKIEIYFSFRTKLYKLCLLLLRV